AFMKGQRPALSAALAQFAPVWGLFLRNRWGLLAGFASLLVVDGLQLLVPVILKKAVDGLAADTAIGADLLSFAVWILAIAGGMAVFRYLWRFFLLGHSRLVERELRSRLYARLQILSPHFYQERSTGDLMARAVNDLNAVRMATGMGLAALTDAFVMGAAAVGFMLAIDPGLTAVALIPAPFVVLASRVYTRRMSRSYERVQARFGSLTERVREAFSGIRVIKAHGREEWASGLVRGQGEGYAAENIQLARTLGMFFPMMSVFTNLGFAIVVWRGGGLAVLDRITTGDFVAFTTYLNLLTWPMMAMGWVTNLIQRGGASMERINAVLTAIPEIADPGPSPGTPEILRGELAVKGLSFSYPGTRDPVLSDVSLTSPQGSFAAVVGPVGSGKSSLVQAFARMVNVPPGTVFVDGADVCALPLPLLRKSVGFVPQEPVVFSDTLAANVIFGRENVDAGTLSQAMAVTRLNEDAEGFDKGVDTLVGERGLTLSGGQRQRLTLARALAGDPPVLILDDALSMVDTRTEKAVIDDLLALRRGRTTVAVTHRVSAMQKADVIFVLTDGRLEDLGTHAELMGRCGAYCRLYERQLLTEENGEGSAA
ncbi:MAG: ABC transporter ATP-binding protein, partial [Pseudomonadota bacterium]